jgi:hypothetical protein
MLHIKEHLSGTLRIALINNDAFTELTVPVIVDMMTVDYAHFDNIDRVGSVTWTYSHASYKTVPTMHCQQPGRIDRHGLRR